MGVCAVGSGSLGRSDKEFDGLGFLKDEFEGESAGEIGRQREVPDPSRLMELVHGGLLPIGQTHAEEKAGSGRGIRPAESAKDRVGTAEGRGGLGSDP